MTKEFTVLATTGWQGSNCNLISITEDRATANKIGGVKTILIITEKQALALRGRGNGWPVFFDGRPVEWNVLEDRRDMEKRK